MLVSQLYLTLCDPMNCNLPGSSVHEILQARILDWVAIPFSRGSSQPRDQTWVCCIVGRFFTISSTKKTSTWKDTCTPVFIAALFTIARTWKQPKCPLTEEWIKKICYIYTMEYYSATKKNKIMAFTVTWMDLEIVILSEVSQTVKEKYHMTSLICGI